ncbi:M20/M25/M40 family metallo-hydrolase [Henriciella aquimarina]|uniref:M20/M25/M40 family metallo-hydrolase n=1 Tax=Henriciella aquimarina TaxID=545261 RepID=UPI001301B284|nr:M20/M25/M40 family metallo-hydrolase [Henriciella aquimarina]
MKQIFLATALLLAACSNAPAFETQGPASATESTYQAQYHNAARAMEAVGTLASEQFEGRKTGEPGNRKAMEWIEAQLVSLGVSPPRREGYRMSFDTDAPDDADRTVEATNLVAFIRGKDEASPKAIVISAHYDHLGIQDGELYPGADDNASGVAALLETIAWFQAHPPETTIIFAFFDKEEYGLGGAEHFLEALSEGERGKIALNINLDMVARADKGELYAVGGYHFPDLVPLIDAVAAKAPITLFRGHDSPGWGDQDWSLLSDHAPFLQAGIPFIYLGVEDHADYHKPSDTAENIDPAIFARCIDTIILMAEAADDWVAKR